MGRSKTVFNTKDLFIEGQNNTEVQLKFIRSPLFPIAVNAYNRAKAKNLDLRVGFIETNSFTGGEIVSKVNLVTPLGVPVALISNSNGTYTSISFSTYSSHTENPQSAYRQLSSSNPKYVQSKLSVKSEHDAASAFDTALVSAHNFFDQTLRGIVDSLVDHVSGDRHVMRPLVSSGRLQDEAATFLLKVFAGDCTFAEMPLDMRATLDTQVKEYKLRCLKFDQAIDDSIRFMDGDKWLFMPGMNKGVVLACISPDGIVEALKRYRIKGFLPYVPDLVYAKMAIAPKWYPSFEAIPDDIREGLQFSMVMLKTHLNSSTMLPKECHGGKFFTEMGCYSQSAWNEWGSDVHLLSR